ncbi:right-handed parallel beta-helix repeat-containing protein [Arthrobacter sp. PAMC 25486]|uniref:right-handed parallel beta-helix repeat-containing protein n=1 Tax=Arthrobacter sp. PAMC 25486 TaxID=1494608 RepID=UPI00138E359F|nr:right-handed parallel beta-helix repeat-containing protein [Arthrobacter sp. PAMC 25486]
MAETVTGAAVHTENKADAAQRVLFSDDFSANDGAKWIEAKSNAATDIRFADDMASIKGGGAENRILSNSEILADNFTLDLDLFIHEGNTNSASKVGFLASESAGSRYQVTFDGPKKQLRLERVEGGAVTVVGGPVSTDLTVNSGGEPHRISIEVDEDQVRATVNGELLLTVAEAGTASAAQGRILVAGQFPNQDFSVDNVRVTTMDPEVVGEYKVKLSTETNKALDVDPGTAGGTLTANRNSGNDGDVVTLSYTVKPGYVFDGYESKRLDTNTSTDGLLTIADNRFTFNDKTGSVIIIAKFVTEPDDPNVIFKDHFDGELNEHGNYAISAPGDVSIADGELRLTPTQGPAYVLVDGTEWAEPVNYRIEFDARKADGSPGTTQVAFRTAGFDERYVLALNGSKAMLRRLDNAGNNVELASTLYNFDQTARRFLIDVSGDTVSVSANATPILSYTNRDDPAHDSANWSGVSPGFALINMTPGASMAFDNVKVARTPVYVKANVQVTNAGEPDPEQVSGAVVLSEYTTAGGKALTWKTYPKGGYRFTGISFEGQTLPGDQFVVPEGATTDITLVANFEQHATAGTTYYIDSEEGDDAQSGTSPGQPWAGLAKANRTLHPGDKIVLKRGSVFEGASAALAFTGSGTAQNPIIVGAYGEGERPQLNGAGVVENVVSLHNQEYIHVSGLEITNRDPLFDSTFGLNTSTNTQKNLRAVNISARDFGVVHGITVTDLFIHDINGNLNSKWNGGIFFNVAGSVVNGEILGVPTKFDDVLIEGNKFERVDRSGIKLVDSVWSNQSLANSPNTPLNWYPSTNVVVRDNQFRHVGGDAITVRDTDGTLVEYNLVRHARFQNTGYNAGIWPFQTTNSVIQYNEVSNTHGVQDGQGLDLDHVSAYSVMQYNYSHNNEGGFMLIMNGFPHTAPTIRYNISQNDADKTFEFARGTAAGTMIHNNTIYSATTLQGPRGGVLDLANSGAGTGNREVFIFNNVFHYPAGQTFYVGEAATMKTKAKLFNNAYAGGISVPDEEERAITGELGLPDVGAAPEDNSRSTAPLTGVNAAQHFAGYAPTESSVLRNAGLSLEEVVAHFGGTVTDRSDMSPTQVHALALQAPSIDFVAGHNMPKMNGVRYDVDFLGNVTPGAATGDVAEGLTVGAIQYLAATPDAEPTTTPEPTVSPEPTTTPEPTVSPEPTTTPEPTVSPEPTTTPEPTVSPEPTTTPEPTVSPQPTTDPEPTTDPSSSPDSTNLPEPSATDESTGRTAATTGAGSAAATDGAATPGSGSGAADRDELASTGMNSTLGLSIAGLALLLLIAGGVLRRTGKRA